MLAPRDGLSSLKESREDHPATIICVPKLKEQPSSRRGMRPWPREGWEIHGGTKGTSESRVHKKTSPRRDGQSTQMHRDVGETRVQEDVCYWNFNSVNRERIGLRFHGMGLRNFTAFFGHTMREMRALKRGDGSLNGRQLTFAWKFKSTHYVISHFII